MPRQPTQKIWFEKVSWSREPLLMRTRFGAYSDLDRHDARLTSELKIRRYSRRRDDPDFVKWLKRWSR